ncbi:chlorophyllase-1, chloroplastic [Manihot esculenta]|uniref:Uncharacterized protein n=1 Tax=Manihot esculenta TaxID=3983 RepID=A0A2C9VUE6_MANES|nr:chlorophyllase-1, chloroplastic [Manihot esculenta]OAY49764.1 hypothetical protein MANES_05G081300v8 [Manihot esculenta]
MLLAMTSQSSEVVKPILTTQLPVFEAGNISTKPISMNTPTKPLFIISPIVEGNYPVFLFFHGICTSNSVYTHLFNRIDFHGCMVVAPQLYTCLLKIPTTSENDELSYAAETANGLLSGLHTLMGTWTSLLFHTMAEMERQLLHLLLDPVARWRKGCRCDPY